MIILKKFKDIRGDIHYVNPQQVASIEENSYWRGSMKVEKNILHTSNGEIVLGLSVSEIAEKLGICIDIEG